MVRTINLATASEDLRALAEGIAAVAEGEASFLHAAAQLRVLGAKERACPDKFLKGCELLRLADFAEALHEAAVEYKRPKGGV